MAVLAGIGSTAPRRQSTGHWLLGSGLGRTRADLGALALILVVAFLVRLLPLLAGGGFTGLMGYDDGVYFGASIALTEGVLPYRDYLLLHPPGEPVALLPFALIGQAAGDDVGFAAARLATMLLGGGAAVLAAIVAGRYQRLAGIAGGLLYATWSTAAHSDRSTDLHTVQAALVFAACLVLVQPGRIGVRRAVLAGVPLGLATTVQVWQGVTVAILLVWVAIRAPRSRASLRSRLGPPFAFGLASVAAFAVVCLPFLVAAPWAMVRYVIVDQETRPAGGVPMLERLRVLEGLPQTSQLPASLRGVVPDALVIVVAIVAGGVLLVTAARLTWTRPWAVLALASTVVVMRMPSFFNDYVAFVAPPAVLLLGTAAGWSGRYVLRSGHARLALVTAGVLLVAVGGVSLARRAGQPLDLPALRADVAGAPCVSADNPGLLIMTGALRSSLAHGCRLVLDPTGIRHDADRTSLPGGKPAVNLREASGYQAAMVQYYGGSTVALFTTNGGFTDATRATIDARLPAVHREGIVTVRRAAP
jgi:alpha-1,2-mannosyltransferase